MVLLWSRAWVLHGPWLALGMPLALDRTVVWSVLRQSIIQEIIQDF